MNATLADVSLPPNGEEIGLLNQYVSTQHGACYAAGVAHYTDSATGVGYTFNRTGSFASVSQKDRLRDGKSAAGLISEAGQVRDDPWRKRPMRTETVWRGCFQSSQTTKSRYLLVKTGLRG